MKKLASKTTVMSDGITASSANRIEVGPFVRSGLLTWINTIIRPFGIQLISDIEANVIYPARTSFRITTASTQANMSIGMARFIKNAAEWLPEETKKACEEYK